MGKFRGMRVIVRIEINDVYDVTGQRKGGKTITRAEFYCENDCCSVKKQTGLQLKHLWPVKDEELLPDPEF